MSNMLFTGMTVKGADGGRFPFSYKWLHVPASRLGKE